MSLALLAPAHHHIGLPAAAGGTHQPLTPIEHGRCGAVPLGHVGWVGLDLVTAIATPYDKTDAGRG
jgi:hypothetical protein